MAARMELPKLSQCTQTETNKPPIALCKPTETLQTYRSAESLPNESSDKKTKTAIDPIKLIISAIVDLK